MINTVHQNDTKTLMQIISFNYRINMQQKTCTLLMQAMMIICQSIPIWVFGFRTLLQLGVNARKNYAPKTIQPLTCVNAYGGR